MGRRHVASSSPQVPRPRIQAIWQHACVAIRRTMSERPLHDDTTPTRASLGSVLEEIRDSRPRQISQLRELEEGANLACLVASGALRMSRSSGSWHGLARIS